MHRQSFFSTTLAAVGILLLTSIAAFAQTGALRGHVVLKDSEGKSTPVAGAVIDVFRTDVAGKYETKTDKKGNFVFAGLPLGGTYVIAASAPNISPQHIAGVRVGQEVDYEITVTPGDGRRLTREEVLAAARPAAGGAAAPKESAADRAKREEMARKAAEIEEKNKKITETNEIVSRTFKAGNEAFNAKRYDEAIAQYDQGIAADETHPARGVLLMNKSAALRLRGVDRFNTAARSTDDAAKTSGLEAARNDFRAAAEAATKAVEFIKSQPAETDPARQTQQNTDKLLALSARAEAMRLFVTKVDQSQADAGAAAFQEYIAAETDPAKKAKAQVNMAQMLLDSGQGDKALAEYQKILAAEPDNVDALRGAGLALFQSGEKAKFQEAANYLQRFVDKAPDTNPEKQSAKEALEYLKSQENVRPERTTTTGGRRRRG